MSTALTAPVPLCPVCTGSLAQVLVWRRHAAGQLILCLDCASVLDPSSQPLRALTDRELSSFTVAETASLSKAQEFVRNQRSVS